MGGGASEPISLFYLTSVDVSLTNGTAIAEREWIAAALEGLRGRVRVAMPRPRQELAELADYRVAFLPAGPGHPRARAKRMRQALPAIRRELLEDFQPDLLAARPGLYPWTVLDSLRRVPAPLVLKSVDARAADLPIPPSQDDSRRARLQGLFRHPAHWLLMRRLMGQAAAVDTYTSELARRLQTRYGLGPERVQTLPDGVNVRRFRPWNREEARRELGMELAGPVIGLVATHPASQGGEQLLQLVAHLREDYPNIRALVVGSDTDAMHRLARRTGLVSHCELPGLVAYEALPRYINAMDLGLILQPSDRSEAVGGAYQKMRQFLACGRPVVAAAQGNKFLQSAGLGSLVPAEDVGAQARAVREWVEMPPTQRQEWATKAVDYAERHLSTRRALQDRLAFWGRFAGP